MTKDKPCAVFDLYIKVDQVIIATQTDALTNIRSNTISAEVVSIFERTLLVEAVARAVAKGFPFVETSKKDISIHGDGPAPLEKAIELACAQVESWDDLERCSIYFRVTCFEHDFDVFSFARSEDGLWNHNAANKLKLPEEVDLEGVMLQIIDDVRGRNDFQQWCRATAIEAPRYLECHYCNRKIVDRYAWGVERRIGEWPHRKVYWCEECRELEETVEERLWRKFRMPYIDLTDAVPRAELLELLGEDWIRKNKVAPVKVEINYRLVVAMVDPFDYEAETHVTNIWQGKGRVYFCVCEESAFCQFLLRAFPQNSG